MRQFYATASPTTPGAGTARCQNHVLFMNHAIVNPPVDRMKSADQVKDVFITIQKETDAGIVCVGRQGGGDVGRAHALQLPRPERGDADSTTPISAVMFIAPMNLPGMKIICRASYEMIASVMGTPFDYPLSSRFDENDAIFVFDNVLIPWENVLVHRDIEKLKVFFPRSGFLAGYQFQGCTRLAVKLDFLVRPHRQGAARGGLGRIPRQPGDARRGDRLAQSVLGAVGRDGAQSDAVGRRCGAAERAIGLEPTGCSPATRSRA